MYKAYDKNKFYSELEKCSTKKDNDIILTYLKSSGYISDLGSGKINVSDDTFDVIKKISGSINVGDIIWSETHGMLLVFDKPCIIGGEQSYRGLPIQTNDQGRTSIISTNRSIMVEDTNIIRMRHASFDTDTIKHLCEERSQYYVKINDINDRLSKLIEETDHVS